MFGLTRSIRIGSASQRFFSTSASRQHDLAKLTLVGRIGKEAESRFTTTNKEYVTYTIATQNYPPPPPNPDGSRPAGTTSWHHVYCFNPNSYEYLKKLPKGSQVFVEANYELREPSSEAEEGTPQAQRQIFLRHETLRLLRAPRAPAPTDESG